MGNASLNSAHQIPLSDPCIRYIGRVCAEKERVFLDWTASGFELRVRGGTVKACLSGADTGDALCTWMGVYINGERTQKFRLRDAPGEWYELATDLPEDVISVIRVLKLSEAQQGTAELTGVTITGELLEPIQPERRIVWIGDSITCGFGNLGKLDDLFVTETEDGTLTYASLIAERYGAEQQVIAASGHGVATNIGGTNTAYLMPQLYPYTRFVRSPQDDGFWDYDQFQPDLVVVNLGTNDAAGGSDEDTLRNGMRPFLDLLRTAHPKSTLVWIYGFMINGLESVIREEIETFAQKDKNTHYLPIERVSGAEELGTVGHPSAAAHLRLAKTLGPQLAEIMGWN